jgi:hypothetical protein
MFSHLPYYNDLNNDLNKSHELIKMNNKYIICGEVMSQPSGRIFFSKSDAVAIEAQVSIVSLKRKVYKLIESGLETQLCTKFFGCTI